MVELVKAPSRDKLLQVMLKFQGALFLIAGLVIYFGARTPGKIIALVILFVVFSVAAYVHLQVRYERAERLRSPSKSNPRRQK